MRELRPLRTWERPGVVDVKSTPTVLVVEDDLLLRITTSDQLRDCGFHVIEARSGDEALQVLEAGIWVDVVFSDLHMPGRTNGIGLAQWIRREQPKIKVILTSGTAGPLAAAATELCDNGAYFEKPYQLVTLERRIRELIAAEVEQYASKARA